MRSVTKSSHEVSSKICRKTSYLSVPDMKPLVRNMRQRTKGRRRMKHAREKERAKKT